MLQKPLLVISLSSLFLVCVSLVVDTWTAEIWKETIWQFSRDSVTQPWEVLDWIYMFGMITFIFSLSLMFYNQFVQIKMIRFYYWSLLLPTISLWFLLFENGGGFISFGGYEQLLLLWGLLVMAVSIIGGLVYKFLLPLRG